MLIGYARVSTSKQGQSLDTQREVLIDAGCDPNRHHLGHEMAAAWLRRRACLHAPR